MRWMLVAAIAAIAGTLCLPGEAAQPDGTAAPSATRTGNAAITFPQYRQWRNDFNARRLHQLESQLAAGGLEGDRKTRLERVKAYYDRLVALPDDERDRLYRARFDRIDSNHDGVMDPAERAAWREKRRSLHRRFGAAQPAAATER